MSIKKQIREILISGHDDPAELIAKKIEELIEINSGNVRVTLQYNSFDPDNQDTLEAFRNAELNHRRLEGLYNEVFRPVIKYGPDDKSHLYLEVWEDVRRYLEE